MKKIVSLMIAAFFAASFCAFAQNNTEVLQQAQQQLQDRQGALDDAERAHRQQQAESRRNINAAERQIDANKATLDQSKKRIQAMKEDIKAREAEIKIKKQAIKLEKESLKLDGRLDSGDKARLKMSENELKVLERAVKDADLVIGSVLVPGGSTPKLFKRAYLPEMKNGAVFVDVAIDQGGCGESSHVTTHDDPVFIEDGVVHYCVGNMPGAVPRTSTIALTNATLRYGLEIANKGIEQAIADSEVIASGVNCYDGKVTCQNLADSFDDVEYVDIHTLI